MAELVIIIISERGISGSLSLSFLLGREQNITRIGAVGAVWGAYLKLWDLTYKLTGILKIAVQVSDRYGTLVTPQAIRTQAVNVLGVGVATDLLISKLIVADEAVLLGGKV